MASTRDNVDVLQMLGEFNDFLSRTPSERRRARSSTSSLKDSNLNVVAKLHFEDSVSESFDSSVFNQSNVSYSRQGCLNELKKMLRDKDVELISLKNAISKLETELISLRSSNKKARLEFDNDLDVFKGKNKREHDKLEDVELQLRTALEKNAEILQEFQEFRKKSEAVKVSYERKLQSLQSSKLQTESSLKEELDTVKSQILELRNERIGNQEEFAILKSELDESKERLKLNLRRNEESIRMKKDLTSTKQELMKAELKITELRNDIVRLEEANVLARTVHSHLQQIPELEAENKKLKEQNRLYKEESKNVLLLEEKLDGLQKALDRAEKRYSDLLHLQSENEELKAKLTQWEMLAPSQAERSPQKVAHQITDLRQQEAMLLVKLGTLNSSVNSLEKEKKALEQKLVNYKHDMEREKMKLQQTSDTLKRLQRKLLLVSKERDSFKQLIDSYENEVTINYGNTNKGRIDELETIIQHYHNHVEKLEADLTEANKKCLDVMGKMETASVFEKQQHTLVMQLNEQLQKSEQQSQQLQAQVSELEKAVELLKSEKEGLETQLEFRALKGDYNPAITKVVHFNSNPLSIARQHRLNELEKVRKENEALKERVRLLQENKDADANLTAIIEENLQNKPSSVEVEELKEQLKAAELRYKRLNETYDGVSQEFREVCHLLTGYRIYKISDKQYRVLSMYAESQDNFLIFKLTNKGTMELLETEYVNHLDSLIETYLTQHDSIPAFLSALTIKLFNEQTQLLDVTLVSN